MFELVGLPSPFLFAGVVAGAVVALGRREKLEFPEWGRKLGIGLVGVAAGGTINTEIFGVVADEPVAVFGGVGLTLLVSMAIGQLLRRSPHVDAATALFASIAGGASGVSAVARETGANDAIVVAIQYLRVLLVLVTIPVVSSLLGASNAASAPVDPFDMTGAAFTLVASGVGLLLARVLPFTAAGLVLPLLTATALSLSQFFPATETPVPILAFAYSAIGLMVGLQFSRSTVRELAQLMPLGLFQITLSVVVCGLIGIVFARVAGISPLDGYLATTPGGLPAVTAIAVGSSASVGLIISMQLLRLFLALLLAPALGYLLRRRP